MLFPASCAWPPAWCKMHGTTKSVNAVLIVMPETSTMPDVVSCSATRPGDKHQREVAEDRRGRRHQDRLESRARRTDHRSCLLSPSVCMWFG